MKALACERPVDEKRQALARRSVYDIYLQAGDLGAPLFYSTVWRRLRGDALRPWLFQQWLFPRDPPLLTKATPILELYHGRWDGVTVQVGAWVRRLGAAAPEAAA